MFDHSEEEKAIRALRAGLVDLPTPEVSADFDARIQAALLRPPSWRQSLWQGFWTALRPALPVAACTLTGTLMLLHVMQQTPAETRLFPNAASSASVMQQRPQSLPSNARANQVEETLENRELSDASVSLFGRSLHRSMDKSG